MSPYLPVCARWYEGVLHGKYDLVVFYNLRLPQDGSVFARLRPSDSPDWNKKWIRKVLDVATFLASSFPIRGTPRFTHHAGLGTTGLLRLPRQIR